MRWVLSQPSQASGPEARGHRHRSLAAKLQERARPVKNHTFCLEPLPNEKNHKTNFTDHLSTGVYALIANRTCLSDRLVLKPEIHRSSGHRAQD